MVLKADTILVVDDTEAQRYAVARTLRKAGFNINEASSGREALRCAASIPDAIILDVNLPDMSGYDVCRELKATTATAHIPVIHVSAAYVRPEDKVEGLDSGADAYLLQPCSPDELVATVRAIIRIRTTRAAAENERAQWQAVVQGIADEVWVCDTQGRMSVVNLPEVTLMGLEEFKHNSVEQVLQKVEILNPDGQPRPPEQSPLLRSLRGEIVRGEEIMRHRLTGRMRWRQFSSAPTRDAAGNITGAVAIVRDITEHKRLQEELQSVAQFPAENPNPVLRLGRGGQVLYTNQAAAALLAGHECLQHDSASPGVLWDRAEASLHTGKVEEFDVVCDDGRVFSFTCIGVPAKAYANLYGRDATAARRAEEALRQNEQRLRGTFDNAGVGIVEVDQEDRFIAVNDRVCEILGYRREELLGMCVRDITAPEDRSQSDLLNARLHEGQDERFENEKRYLRRDGSPLWVHVTVSAVRDSAGNFLRAIATVQDISERKQAQEALIRSEKLASMGRMAATIAHEINNPLAAITNLLYLVAADPALSPQTRAHLKLAEGELNRAAHITKQTLGFYREYRTACEVSVPELVDEVLTLYATKLEAKKTKVVKSCCKATGNLAAVAGEIRQVISNLLSNSIDAMEPGGTLQVRVGPAALRRTGKSKPAVRITIADTGTGISPEHRARIFEPFFTTKQTLGTGLGLWVTREIVYRHGGLIQVHSQEGKGTTFSVVLPRDRAVL
jgi:PAS domain S-box-containing protein